MQSVAYLVLCVMNMAEHQHMLLLDNAAQTHLSKYNIEFALQ